MTDADAGTGSAPTAVTFDSTGNNLAALHYPAGGSTCVVMAAGPGVPQEPGTERFARRFQAAGHHVMTFDYRSIGRSEGTPRAVVRPQEQLADWRAALTTARALPGVDPLRVVAWGYSISGGYLFELGAEDHALAAAIAIAPIVDGLAASRNALRHQRPAAVARLGVLMWFDGVRSVLDLDPFFVPLTAEPDTPALATTPDAADASRALDPGGTQSEWDRTIAARSLPAVGRYQAKRFADQVHCPMLIVVANDDTSALAEPAKKAAAKVPLGQLVEVEGGHYAPYLDAHEEVVEAQLSFLDQTLSGTDGGSEAS